jgi:hypothetical protein
MDNPADLQVQGLVRDLLHWHDESDPALPREALKVMKAGNSQEESAAAVQCVLGKLQGKVQAELLPSLQLHDLKVALVEAAQNPPPCEPRAATGVHLWHGVYIAPTRAS